MEKLRKEGRRESSATSERTPMVKWLGDYSTQGWGARRVGSWKLMLKGPKFGFEPIKGTQKHHNTIRDHTLKNGKLNIFDQNQKPYEPIVQKKLINQDLETK